MTDSRRLDSTILREYDIRGIVGETLAEEDVRVIGHAFGSIMRRRGVITVAVGYDGRLSSPALEAALVDGLAASGVRVVRIGLGPTPMLYFATHELETDAGVMITGSHNPPQYNGIKIVLDGNPFFSKEIQDLGELAAVGNFEIGEGIVTDRSVLKAYVERLVHDFPTGREFRVAWDAGNGAAGEALCLLAAKLPGEHVLLNDKIDGTFPAHHPDPTVEDNLQQLKAAVAEHDCELGIAFDGDGDRIGVVDAVGRVIWGDQLLTILAREVLTEEPGATIIADVKTSRVFFDEIARLGGAPLMWKTGHSHIKNKMTEIGAPLAGEMSAHIFFKHRYYGFDDALYVAVRLLGMLAGGDQKLAEIRDSLPVMFNTPELRFDCAEDRKFAVVDEVGGRLALIDGIEVTDIDGVRVGSDDGWWLLRASNTQAALVARCESGSQHGLERLKDALFEQLRLSDVEPPYL